jgi:hypothetical protein
MIPEAVPPPQGLEEHLLQRQRAAGSAALVPPAVASSGRYRARGTPGLGTVDRGGGVVNALAGTTASPPRRDGSIQQPTAGIALGDVSWDGVVGPFTCFGRSWSIRTTDDAVTEYLRSLFAPMEDLGWRGPVAVVSLIAPGPGRVGAVYRDDEYIGSSHSPARLLGHLIWAINRLVIQPSRTEVVLHAAAAATPYGDAIVLPAPMESGKTTLVTGLLDRGLTYLTDEAALIDDEFRVWGYRKPLSIDPGSWGVLAHHRPVVPPVIDPYHEDQWQVAAATFAPTSSSATMASIVLPRYERGAEATLCALEPAEAVRRLVECTFGPKDATLSLPQMSKLARFASSVPVYDLTAGQLDEACAAVLSTLGPS